VLLFLSLFNRQSNIAIVVQRFRSMPATYDDGVQNNRLQDRLAAILTICQRMNAVTDLDMLLDLVVREAAALLEADRASIFLLDATRTELQSHVALGSGHVLRFDARKGIAGAALTSGQVINVADAYEDSRFNRAIDAMTGYHTRNLLAAPMRSAGGGEIVGVFEVLNKKDGPFTSEDEELLRSLATQAAMAIQNARSIAELNQENANLRREMESGYARQRILGASPKIQAVLNLIERIQNSSVNVLITGESGTGKDLAARALHYGSPRARRPFIALNCAALPENLVESELFGIEKGVATGVNPRAGLFQEASGGTLFLDEIGDLSLTAQAKILRVLEAKVVLRVGGRIPIPVDVRLVSATNKDLATEIKKGTFREDLYYRLKVVQIRMPSLREIDGDIPLLANHFLAECCAESGRQLEFSSGLLRRIMSAQWPGNVRQLQNEIRRLAACATGRVISEDELAEEIAEAVDEPSSVPGRTGSLKEALEDLERRLIADTMRSMDNNQQRAAKALGLSRQGLINKLNRYRLIDER
jgi:Nif-specific regulatory protein